MPDRCVFVDAFVCVSGCRHLYLCGSGVGGGGVGCDGVCDGVCVCVCVCRVLCDVIKMAM